MESSAHTIPVSRTERVFIDRAAQRLLRDAVTPAQRREVAELRRLSRRWKAAAAHAATTEEAEE